VRNRIGRVRCCGQAPGQRARRAIIDADADPHAAADGDRNTDTVTHGDTHTRAAA